LVNVLFVLARFTSFIRALATARPGDRRALAAQLDRAFQLRREPRANFYGAIIAGDQHPNLGMEVPRN
jgi:hypothetical protein